jgi:peptidyl-prolyl cis-trans isomerase SurA
MSKIIIILLLLNFTPLIITDALCVVIDKIVAVVNDEVITQQEINQHLLPIYDEYKKEYTGRRLENKMAEAKDMILDQLIDDKLILAEAKRQKIEATDKEIEIKLQEIKNRFETEEQFREILARQNISLTELRDRLKSDIIKSKLVRREVGWKIAVTPSEVRDYYDTHIEDFTEPEKRRVLNIVIKKTKKGRAKDETIFLIKKIKELIEQGQDFEELAKEYSEGAHAKKGGHLGLVEKGQMIEEIDDAIFLLKVGEISDIVESSIGYHIFKVSEIILAYSIDFEVAKYEIEDLIYREKIDKNLKKLLKRLRKNAYISIK